MAAISCWEHLKCGREKECPAYPRQGTVCWTLEATMCRGEQQGGYEQKIKSCRQKCEYYNGVMDGSIKIT